MSRQGRRQGVVMSGWSIDQGSYLTEDYLRDFDQSNERATGVGLEYCDATGVTG